MGSYFLFLKTTALALLLCSLPAAASVIANYIGAKCHPVSTCGLLRWCCCFAVRPPHTSNCRAQANSHASLLFRISVGASCATPIIPAINDTVVTLFMLWFVVLYLPSRHKSYHQAVTATEVGVRSTAARSCDLAMLTTPLCFPKQVLTEDYSVHVRGLPAHASAQQVACFFSRFGTVLYVGGAGMKP